MAARRVRQAACSPTTARRSGTLNFYRRSSMAAAMPCASRPRSCNSRSALPCGTNSSGMPIVSAGVELPMRASSASTPSPTPPASTPPSTVTTSFVRAAAAMACTSKGFTQRMSTTRACTPRSASSSAAPTARDTMRPNARMATSSPSRTTFARPGSNSGGSSGTGTPSAVPRGYRMANGPPRASAVCSAPASSASFEGASTRKCGTMRV